MSVIHGVIREQSRDSVTLLVIDDGASNAITATIVDEIHRGIDRAESAGTAVVLAGRAGRFCSGISLSALVEKGGTELYSASVSVLTRLLTLPAPTVGACTGSALGGGAALLLAFDHRVGAEQTGRIGMLEVALGIPLPKTALVLAEARLSKPMLPDAVLGRGLLAIDRAITTGFLDEAVQPEGVIETAVARAASLASLPRQAFGTTKRAMYADLVTALQEAAEEDCRRLPMLLRTRRGD